MALAVFCGALYAQNGIPLNVLTDDPYFQNGAAEAERIRQKERAKNPDAQEDEEEENPFQYTNPEDSKTFYNAENWTYEELRELSEEDKKEITPDLQQDPNKKRTEEQRETEPVEWNEEEAVLENEEEHLLHLNFTRTHGNANVAYSPFYILPLAEKGMDYYFGSSFNYIGVTAGANYFFKNWRYSAFSVGTELGWNLLKNEQKHYTLQSNQFTGDLRLNYHQVLGELFAMDIHLGAGATYLNNLYFAYHSGYNTEVSQWIYPMVTGGVNVDYFVSSFLFVGLGLNENWLFLIERPYSFLKCSLRLGWRF